MAKIVIHAGTPKAGSSAIQHWLAGNAKRLRREHGITLAIAVAADPIRVTAFKGRGSINSHAVGLEWMKGGQTSVQSLERLFSDLDALSEEHPFLLLTSETLDEALWRSDEGFLSGLNDLAAEHSVVLSYYVRPQHTAMEAAWRQWGFRYATPPSTYLRRRARRLDYATTYNQLRALAPRVVFEVRPFRADLLDAGNVVVDFARHNLEVEVVPSEAPPINRGLPLEVVNLLRAAPRGRFWSSEHDNSELRRIKELIGDLEIPESAEVRRSRRILQAFCHETFEAGNRELIRELGWATTEFVPGPDEPVDGGLEDLDELWSVRASGPEREILFYAIEQAVNARPGKPKQGI